MATIKKLRIVAICMVLALGLCAFVTGKTISYAEETGAHNFIKWVDLNFTDEILNKVYQLDIKHNGGCGDGVRFRFVEVLAYLAVKNGNQFSSKDVAELERLVKKMGKGYVITDDFGTNKYYNYYLEAFSAVFDRFIGIYQLPSGEVHYGLTAYFPLARGYWYNHYDDFGNSRSFGFKRKHLGHDIMGGVGTPVVAIEGGTVTELGWNRYGGWRVGILSFDKTRYYYYAHLRKNHPFANGLKLGDAVDAGQTIGFLGMTGYSDVENQNLKSGKPHLHLGLQLIFDESQSKGNKEIWVDLYAITNFLQRNRARVVKNSETNEYQSVDLRHRLDEAQQSRRIFMHP